MKYLIVLGRTLKNSKRILTACIAFGMVAFVPTSSQAAMKIKAKSEAEAMLKGWKQVKKGRQFRRWSEGVRFTDNKSGKKCRKIVFVGGNGKVWYIHIKVQQEKKGSNVWLFNSNPKRSKRGC